ncbi:MAG: hypothetical protein IPM42_09410 [Saprospiraceae bacterium]|nr:hypothetical protein [Saprospiraceae bacterium]
MYDTVNLWLPIHEIGNLNVSNVLQQMQDYTEHETKEGQNYYTGTFDNYKVSVSGQGVSLKGSIAKYFLPDNFHTLTRSDSTRAFIKLSDELHLPIMKAKVRRIDFAQNLMMDYRPESYYPYLGESRYYLRQPQGKSLYYSNGQKQKVFYNKVAEGKAKKLILPEVWTGQNVLRYENRHLNRLTDQFKLNEITASTLTDQKFYISIFEKWYSEYESIQKINSINFNLQDMNSPKDFWKQLNLMAVNLIGQEKIMQEVEKLRALKAFDKPEYYSRLKKEIKELCNDKDHTKQSDLISELDRKMKATKNYYR